METWKCSKGHVWEAIPESIKRVHGVNYVLMKDGHKKKAFRK